MLQIKKRRSATLNGIVKTSAAALGEEIKAVVFDFGGVMTTSTMPQRVIELAKEKGVDWEVFRHGFEAHRLDYDAGRITLAEMYGFIWVDAGLSVDAETTAAFMEADDRSWCYRNERTLAWMKALKASGRKIGILSNQSADFAARFPS